MAIPVPSGNRILVAALDWGLGHATRCIPIIKHLLNHNKYVVLGGSGNSGLILRQTFPQLPYVEFPAYNPQYSQGGSMAVSMFFQSRKFFKTISREHEYLKEVIHNHALDMVISDNRFGLHHTQVHTVFITHQLFIRAGIFGWWIKRMNHGYIKKFNECWVPDVENIHESLAGELSHGKHNLPHVTYIGPLSRFEKPLQQTGFNYAACAIVSGPEPLRTAFEEQLMERFTKQHGAYALLRGKPEDTTPPHNVHNVMVYQHPTDAEWLKILSMSKKIICRAGYSTIMDLYVLGRLNQAEFIPTPGQTEQQYLARWITKRHT